MAAHGAGYGNDAGAATVTQGGAVVESMRLPDFLGIGALKAGTTYLDRLLRSHPDLYLPGVKEVNFFSSYYDRGSAWYARDFAGCGRRRAGEVSPEYLTDAQCPARISEVLPNVLLIVSLRDPVERAYSQYKHWVQVSGYEGDFEQFLDDHPNALEGGHYHRHLSRYLQLFERERLHVVIFEDLVTHPVNVMREVFRFLGVDTGHVPPLLQPANVSVRPRFHRAYVQGKRATDWLRRHRGGQLVVWAKRAGAARIFRPTTTEGFAPLTPAAAVRLRDAYRNDVEMLSELLDRDLTNDWTSMSSQ